MSEYLAIAIGGALGAIARFSMSTAVYAVVGRSFPYGTLSVNVLGSFLMGIGFILLTEKMMLGASARALLLIGFLGAFTTFSTFSIETLNLIQQGDAGKALLNMFLSVVLCLLATWLGIIIARIITG